MLVIVAVISFFCGYLLKQKDNVVENLSDNDITEISKNDAMKRAFSADSIPPIDLVKDKETAARIAWAVLFPIYKDEIAQNKNFFIGLKNSTTWVIKGSVWTKNIDDNTICLGGNFYMEINKRDGRISYFLLGK